MWVVMTSSASMQRGCMGTYRNVALVRVHPSVAAGWCKMPSRIDRRIRGVLDIRHLGARNVGKTTRSAFYRARDLAEEMAYRLNNQPEAAGELLATLGGSA